MYTIRSKTIHVPSPIFPSLLVRVLYTKRARARERKNKRLILHAAEILWLPIKQRSQQAPRK